MIKRTWIFCLLLVVTLLLGACGSKASIVGRWQLTATQGSWDYSWMEFFEDGRCTDSWGNDRTWSLLSDGQLKITAGFGAGVYLFDVKITENNIEITDEDGNRAVGIRVGTTGQTVGRAAPSWLPLIGLAVLVLGAIGIFFGFGRVKGIRETTQVALSAGQWRVQASKLASERARLTKERDLAVANLGAQAWQQRVEHPDYGDTFTQLSALEEQRAQAQQELESLNADVHRETSALNQAKADYGARIAAVQDKKNAGSAQLRQLQAEHQAAGKRLGEADKQQQALSNDLRAMQEKLNRAQTSTAGDQQERVATLASGLAALERSSADLTGQLPALQTDVARLYDAQQPFAAEIAQYDQQLTELQAAQKAALDPFSAALSKLQARVRATSERISSISSQMKPLTVDLGSQVARTRPGAPELARAYGEVDRLSSELGAVIDEGNLVKARLLALDAAALRKFYLLIGVTLVVIVVTVVLLIVR